MPIPARTSKIVEIEGLGDVYLKTLNSLEHQESVEEVQKYAGRKLVPFLEGNPDHPALVNEIQDMVAEGQILYLLNANLVKAFQQALTEVTAPAEPEMKEDAEEHAKAIQEYEEAKASLDARRLEFVEKRQAEAEKIYRKMKPQERLEACLIVWRTDKRREWANACYPSYVLQRAVRRPESKTERYFANVEEVLDLDDAVRERLWREYETIDTVKPDEIPTTPSVS